MKNEKQTQSKLEQFKEWEQQMPVAVEVLQKAVNLLNGFVHINFESTGQKVAVHLAQLPAESIAFLLQGGTRKLNDAVNTKANATKTDKTTEAEMAQIRLDCMAEVLEKFSNGTLGQRDSSAGLKKYVCEKLTSKYKLNKDFFKDCKNLEDIYNAVYDEERQAPQGQAETIASWHNAYKKHVEELQRLKNIADDEF